MSPALDFSTAARSRPDPLGRGLLVAGGIAWAAVIALGLGADREARAARARAETVEAEAASCKRRADDLERSAPNEGAALSRALRAAEVPPLSVLDGLSRLLPPDVRLEALAVSYERLGVEVRASLLARSPGAWDVFRRRLETASQVRELRAGAEDRSGPLRTTVSFTWSPGRR